MSLITLCTLTNVGHILSLNISITNAMFANFLSAELTTGGAAFFSIFRKERVLNKFIVVNSYFLLLKMQNAKNKTVI